MADNSDADDIDQLLRGKPQQMDSQTFLLAQVVRGVGKLHDKVDEHAKEERLENARRDNQIKKLFHQHEEHVRKHEEDPRYMALLMLLWRWPKSTLFVLVLCIAVFSHPDIQDLVRGAWKWFLR